MVPMKVAEIVAVTKNSVKLTEPIVNRGVVPCPSSVEGDHRSPSAAADGIEEASAQAKGHEPGWRVGNTLSPPQGFPQDEGAHDQEVSVHEWRDRFTRDRREQVGADGAAHHARQRQPPHEGPINVAEAPVREAGDPGREDFGGMNAGACGCRRDAEAEHHRSSREAVGHSDSTVDELSCEADRDEEHKILQHRPPPWWLLLGTILKVLALETTPAADRPAAYPAASHCQCTRQPRLPRRGSALGFHLSRRARRDHRPAHLGQAHAVMAEPAHRRGAATRAQVPSLLKGLIFGPNGRAMSPSDTRRRGRIYRYYVTREAIADGYGPCGVTSVPAADVEGAVLDQVQKITRRT
jgi:hypothetical protein